MDPNAYLEMAQTEGHHWWFRGRREILESIIAGLDLPPDARILEVGTGTGGNLQMLSTFGTVSGMEMDASARSISMEKTGGRFDIREGHCPSFIPFAKEKFDLVCLFDVLEHIEEDVETLLSLKGLLADGGRILVTVPANPFLWGAHDHFLHHKRRYSESELRAKAGTAGLNVQRLSYYNTLLFPVVAIARLADRIFQKTGSTGTSAPPYPINSFFRRVFGAERHLLRRSNLPFGVSLIAIFNRP